MGLFNNITYKTPERFSPEEARRNRVLGELSRQRKALEVKPGSLSQANKFHLNKLIEFETKFGAEIEARRRRAKLSWQEASVLKSPPKNSPMSRLFKLLQQRSALQQRAASERRVRLAGKATAGDRRLYNPDKFQYPKTVFGTQAHTIPSLRQVTRRMFRHPTLAIPCVQRAIRREVMFAKGHGGKGHKSRHRFNALSLIGC